MVWYVLLFLFFSIFFCLRLLILYYLSLKCILVTSSGKKINVDVTACHVVVVVVVVVNA